MLASLVCNFPFVPKPRPIRWRNRYGEFDTYEEAIARFRQSQPQAVPVAVPVNQRPSDDEALVFIFANL